MSINIYWDSIDGVSEYDIYKSTSLFSIFDIKPKKSSQYISSVLVTTYIDSNVSENVNYFYMVGFYKGSTYVVSSCLSIVAGDYDFNPNGKLFLPFVKDNNISPNDNAYLTNDMVYQSGFTNQAVAEINTSELPKYTSKQLYTKSSPFYPIQLNNKASGKNDFTLDFVMSGVGTTVALVSIEYDSSNNQPKSQTGIGISYSDINAITQEHYDGYYLSLFYVQQDMSGEGTPIDNIKKISNNSIDYSKKHLYSIIRTNGNLYLLCDGVFIDSISIDSSIAIESNSQLLIQTLGTNIEFINYKLGVSHSISGFTVSDNYDDLSIDDNTLVCFEYDSNKKGFIDKKYYSDNIDLYNNLTTPIDNTQVIITNKSEYNPYIISAITDGVRYPINFNRNTSITLECNFTSIMTSSKSNTFLVIKLSNSSWLSVSQYGTLDYTDNTNGVSKTIYSNIQFTKEYNVVLMVNSSIVKIYLDGTCIFTYSISNVFLSNTIYFGVSNNSNQNVIGVITSPSIYDYNKYPFYQNNITYIPPKYNTPYLLDVSFNYDKNLSITLQMNSVGYDGNLIYNLYIGNDKATLFNTTAIVLDKTLSYSIDYLMGTYVYVALLVVTKNGNLVSKSSIYQYTKNQLNSFSYNNILLTLPKYQDKKYAPTIDSNDSYYTLTSLKISNGLNYNKFYNYSLPMLLNDISNFTISLDISLYNSYGISNVSTIINSSLFNVTLDIPYSCLRFNVEYTEFARYGTIDLNDGVNLLNNTYHLDIQYDGSILCVFVNGLLCGSTTPKPITTKPSSMISFSNCKVKNINIMNDIIYKNNIPHIDKSNMLPYVDTNIDASISNNILSWDIKDINSDITVYRSGYFFTESNLPTPYAVINNSNKGTYTLTLSDSDYLYRISYVDIYGFTHYSDIIQSDIGYDPYINNAIAIVGSTDKTVSDLSKNNYKVTSSNALITPTSNSLMNGDTYAVFTRSSSVNLTIPQLNTSDFTLELWAYFDFSNSDNYSRLFAIGSVQKGHIHLCRDNSTSGTSKFLFEILDGQDANSNASSGFNQIASNTTIEEKTWHHFCIQRKDGVFYFHIDGIYQSSISNSKTYSITLTDFYLGYNGSNGEYLCGGMNNIRLTKDVCRYNLDSNFTVKTYLYVMDKYISNLVFYIDGLYINYGSGVSNLYDYVGTVIPKNTPYYSNVYIGFNNNTNVFKYNISSYNSCTLTQNTNTIAYTPSLGSGDFTLEFWFNSVESDTNGYSRILFSLGDYSNGYISIYSNSYSNDLNFNYYDGTSFNNIQFYTGYLLYNINGDNYITVMRKNGIFYFYLNGMYIQSITTIQNYSIGSNLYIGNGNRDNSVNNSFLNIKACRLSNIARYPIAKSYIYEYPIYKAPTISNFTVAVANKISTLNWNISGNVKNILLYKSNNTFSSSALPSNPIKLDSTGTSYNDDNSSGKSGDSVYYMLSISINDYVVYSNLLNISI